MNNPPLWKLSFIVPHQAADAFIEALEEALWPEPLAISTCEAEPGTGPLVQTNSEWNEIEAQGHWRIEALYDQEPDERAVRALLAPIEDMMAATADKLTIEVLPDEDWIARSLEGLAPVRAGRFYIHGSHDGESRPTGAISILIDAAQAFGTGHHETTSGCLEFISEIVKPGIRLNALDLGTGTGVLAIAIAKLARCPVLASDIDNVATLTTRENARLNGVGSFVSAVTAKGFAHPALHARAPYDLIVANILAKPLVSLAPAFRAHLHPGGTLILSGLLRTQEAMITGAMGLQGLRLVSRKPAGDWVTLRMAG